MNVEAAQFGFLTYSLTPIREKQTKQTSKQKKHVKMVIINQKKSAMPAERHLSVEEQESSLRAVLETH